MTTTRLKVGRALLAPGLGALLLAVAPVAARAQGFAPPGNFGTPTGPVVGTANTGKPKPPSPPAIPGTHTDRAEAAPADKNAIDLPPTEALFDAINRGDIVTARDAINRGADLRAQNILGMTPTELSVDLARNDITFLLLSMRGADGAPAPSARAAATTTASAADARKQARLARAPQFAAQPSAAPSRTARVATPAPDSGRQYATGPGTPVPQAGFLGFGGVTR